MVHADSQVSNVSATPEQPAPPEQEALPTSERPVNLLKQLDYAVLQQCMHCGMCLPTCPTYDETKRERSSPRGRIRLMREVADDRLAITPAFADEMSYCLGCLACMTACPAGVDYATLFETARAEVERQKVHSGWGRRLLRWGTMSFLIRRPWLMRTVGRGLWFHEWSGLQALIRRSGLLSILPKRLRDLEAKSPTVHPPFSHALIPERLTPAAPTHRVALLTGCVQDLLYAPVNLATARVLAANGCEVITPRSQPCCGSLHAHNGELQWARQFARANLDAFDVDSLDAIISNAGGCGSHLKKYHELLHDDPRYADRAAQWDSKVRDIHEWLVEISFRKPSAAQANEIVVTYDASCHLLHGQKIAQQPIAVLRAIPGVRFVPLAESDWCCGAAGVYTLTQPEQSQKLLNRKLDHIAVTGASVLATGNPGCLMQLETGIRQDPRLTGMRVCHPVELLAEAYAREGSDTATGPTAPNSRK